ncbi:hypothetical protein [Hymenobacter psoromatis]|nr:hypothetical protein [Hymenobacter psoromatis]
MLTIISCRLCAGLPGWPLPANGFCQAIIAPYPPATAQATRPSQPPLADQ